MQPDMIFVIQAIISIVWVLCDHVSTDLAYNMTSKNIGEKKVQEREMSSRHKWFWKKFGYDKGHCYSSLCEFVVLSVGNSIFLIFSLFPNIQPYFTRSEFLLLWYGFIAGIFVMTIINNYIGYKNEERIFLENK